MKFRPFLLGTFAFAFAACGTLDSDEPGTGRAVDGSEVADPKPAIEESTGAEEAVEVPDDEAASCDVEADCAEAAYSPCSGKACGESCTLCSPDDADCFETAVLKTCDASGNCMAGLAQCGGPSDEAPGCRSQADCEPHIMICEECADGRCAEMACVEGRCRFVCQ